MKRLFIAVILAACASATTAAKAHAFLDHAVPAVGSSVPTAPADVTMWFTQELEPAFSTATVTDKSGNRVDEADAQVNSKDPTELQVSLKKLPPGIYTVLWHILSVDTHTTHGDFTFTVGGG
jgi:copper resistance protein C